MKQMKKTLSLILALVMLLSLGTTAFAGEMGAEEAAVQRVEFETRPDFAVVTVYAGEDEVDAQEDGSYLLIPGEYTYDAAAEGYFPVEKNALTITTVTAETMKVEVVLDAVPVVEEPVVEDVVEAAAVVEEIAEEPVAEEPVVEEPVVEEPVVEEPVVEEPVVEEPVVEEPVAEEPVVEEPVVEEPAEEPVVEEPVVEEPVVENAIVTQPADTSVVSGDVAHFAVETTGEVASYQWQYSANGRRWSNLDARWYGSSEELNLTVSRSDSGYQFRVVVTFADGTVLTSEAARLSVSAAVIVSQPQDVSVQPGENASFSVEVKGAAASYQWQFSKDGKRWNNLSTWTYGSKNVLSFTADKEDDGLLFRVVVTTRDWSKVTSEPAKLTVSEAVTYEARTLEPKVAVEGVSLSVDAPEGALPSNAVLNADPVDVSNYAELIAAVAGDEAEVALALDINFTTPDAGEIEPEEEVTVNLTVPGLSEMQNVKVIHISDDDVASVVYPAPTKMMLRTASVSAPAAAAGSDQITITTKDFSKFVVVGEVIIESDEGSYEFETDEYLITVSFTKEAKIPVGTKLIVSEVPYDSEEYWDLWNKSMDKLNENATVGSEVEPDTRRGITAAVFFDISLIYKENKIEPEVPLEVKIQLKNGGLLQIAGEETKVVHFGEKGTELIDDVATSSTSVLEGMPDGAIVNDFTYSQDGFSYTGVVTTDVYVGDAEYVPNLNPIGSGMLRAAVKAAGDGSDVSISAGKTVTDTDGDGIYELALNVKATSDQSSDTKVTKSNVVMVIDVSGSMGTDNMIYSEYTYDSSTYNSNNQYYRINQNGYYRRVYYRNGAWRTSDSDYGTVHTGTVYLYETRLSATKRAANAVVDALLAYNTNDDNITDIFEITVVKFANRTATGSYNGTQTIIRDSTNATSIKNAINNLSAGGGTNWQAALELAKTEADYFKNTDTSTDPENPENTSVIFLTDGFPSYYGNDNGTGSDSNSNNVQTSYDNARNAARAIVTNGYTLYNIFAFGSDTVTRNGHTGYQYLQALTNRAYNNQDTYGSTTETGKYCFNAKSTADLLAAFNTIIDHITNNVGFAGVNLSDGVSLGATSTSVAVNGTAKAETMRYTVADETGKTAYTVKINSSGAATFTINNADGSTTTLTDSSPETVTTTINGTTINSSVYSVTVGSGDTAKTYKMSPATIDADTGMVKWDLAGLGILESGYTYTVAFDVWPNQLGYDIAADLNNGIYSSVEEALTAYNVTDATERKQISDAIVHNEDGSYSLYTNYEQSVEYYPATSSTDEEGNTTWTYEDKQTQSLDQPDPVPLKGSQLPLVKEWESGLSMSELNELLWKDGVEGGTSTGYKITLYIWKADTEEALDGMINQPISDTNKPYITSELGWNGTDYVFTKSSAVAPGTMVNVNKAAELGFDTSDSSKIKTFTNDEGTTLQYYVIESGHYYYVTESGSDLHFELETDLYHPMIVDGTLYNVFFGEGQTVEKMDPMYAVVATNYLKGGLNINKKVFSDQALTDASEVKDCTDEIAFTITLWKQDGNEVTPVYTTDDQFNGNNAISGSVGYREFGMGANGQFVTLGRDVVIFENSTNAAAKLAANNKPSDSVPEEDRHDPVYATNVDGKTQITLRMPANGEIRLVNLPSGTQYTVTEVVEGSGYNYAQTVSSVKTGTDSGEETITVTGTSTDNTVSGKISGNKANLETYYNWAANFYVYHSSDNTIEKISFTDPRVVGKYENNAYVYSFNIVNETNKNFLYGGYYKSYTGAKMTDAEIKAASYTENGTSSAGVYADAKTTGLWVTDTGATPYTYAYIKDQSRNVWGSDFYTVNGTTANPKSGDVLYLKEVPNFYLLPYTHYTYGTGDKVIRNMWFISSMDDLNYQSGKVGFIVKTDHKLAIIVDTLTVTNATGGATVTLSPKSVFGNKGGTGNGVQAGYIGYWDAAAPLAAKGTVTYIPFWTTMDGVRITGTTSRDLAFNNGKVGSGGLRYTDTATYGSHIVDATITVGS